MTDIRSMEELFAIVDADKSVRCSSEDPTAYSDPSEHFLEKSSRSLASVVRGRFGQAGVVIPRSTRLGGSKGCDPSRPGIIHINPGDPDGLSCSIDLNKLNRQDISAAYRKAASSGDDSSEAIAMKTFLLLSEVSANKKVSDIQPDGLKRKVEKVQQPKDQEQPMPVTQEVLQSTQTPQSCVTIDIGGLAQVDACYHSVIVHGDFLILVYDTDVRGSKFMPRRSEEAVYVTLDNKVYKTVSAGIQFPFVGFELCVLLIEAVSEL